MSYLLIVDDDLDDCLLVEEAWKETGLPVASQCTHNGQSLLQTLSSQNHPALILLDLNMPVMNGKEALQALKANQGTQGIPVVVLSTSQREEDIREVYELGASGFIHKPNSYQAFLSMMESLGDYWFKTITLPSQNS